MASRRVAKELGDIIARPVPGVLMEPDVVDVMSWRAYVLGPDGTPYEGGVWSIQLTFPRDYPIKPMRVVFDTKVYHPFMYVRATRDHCRISSFSTACLLLVWGTRVLRAHREGLAWVRQTRVCGCCEVANPLPLDRPACTDCLTPFLHP